MENSFSPPSTSESPSYRYHEETKDRSQDCGARGGSQGKILGVALTLLLMQIIVEADDQPIDHDLSNIMNKQSRSNTERMVEVGANAMMICWRRSTCMSRHVRTVKPCTGQGDKELSGLQYPGLFRNFL
jgi:hypothetical protein